MAFRNIKDLTNKRFGKLIALNPTEQRSNDCIVWYCKCDCGNFCYVNSGKLNSNWTKSCGCLSKELASNRWKKYNQYDLSGEFGIGYTNKNEEFYFDLEDYNLIKEYCWHYSKNYVSAYDSNLKKHIFLHSLLLNFPNSTIDHEDRNPSNNRKSNLRICTDAQNHRNQSLSKINTSGVTGVVKDHREGEWRAQIVIDGKNITLISKTSFENAVRARLLGEQKYFREFAPQKHLYTKYGIKDG